MTQALAKLLTFDEFVAWYPDSSEHRYELHNGVIVKMPLPTGPHSEVTTDYFFIFWIKIILYKISNFVVK